MCEFKVYLVGDDPADRELVAKGIFVVKKKDEKIMLLDIFGEPKYVESAIIIEVNTISQELILQKV